MKTALEIGRSREMISGKSRMTPLSFEGGGAAFFASWPGLYEWSNGVGVLSQRCTTKD